MRTRKISFADENDFNKKLRALKTYCMRTYKYFIFELTDEDFESKDGSYSCDLPISDEFRLIYGQIKLIYTIKNSQIILDDLEPISFFVDGYMKELNTYKGIYYRDDKDKFKINLLNCLKKEEKKI